MNSAVYEGWVRHRRFAPVSHSFRYRVALAWLDLDELDVAFRGRWLWSVGRRNLAAVHREDYLRPTDRPLDEAVRDRVEAELDWRPRGPVRLLAHPRYFGYCFNPVSFYHCLDAAGEHVDAVLAEITNTPWGERHVHVLDRRGRAGRTSRHLFPKSFHVSPFMGMDVEYDWRLTEPGESLAVHCINREAGRKTFDATLSLRRRELGAASAARVLARYPFMTGRVALAIYWQALRLRLKGAPFHPHPGRHPSPAAEVSS